MAVLQAVLLPGQGEGAVRTVLSPYRESTKYRPDAGLSDLRFWLWTNLGFELYDWAEDEVRF